MTISLGMLDFGCLLDWGWRFQVKDFSALGFYLIRLGPLRVLLVFPAGT